MSKSKFENISNKPIPEEKSAEEIKWNTFKIKKEKEEKEKEKHIELEELTEPIRLFRLKQGDEFFIPGSDRRYRISVKYGENRITAREKGTSNIIELNDGNLQVIHIYTEPKNEKEEHK